MSQFDRCVIATRESPLAMWQALHVQALLRDRYPGASVELLGMTTRGDQILDRTLSKVGGKGLFVKELEVAMQNGEADLAVHSLKDVPMELPEGFELVAVSEREDPRDAFVSPKYASLDEMPEGARVGTASLRRELMLRMRYPHLKVLPVRGNVGTRLRKLDEGEYDALVMASAGLKRLGLSERIRQIIPAEVSLPSPGQGALGLEIRAGDKKMEEALAFINSPETRACCFAERDVSRAAVPARCRSPRTPSLKRVNCGCAPWSATTTSAKRSSPKPAVLFLILKRSPRRSLPTSAARAPRNISRPASNDPFECA